MAAAIECRELVKTYPARPPVEAVRGIDLRIEQGECFGLLGPNGAGKTTTLEIIEGMQDPTSGVVEVLGKRWRDHGPEIRQKIGIALQETRFSDKLRVCETVTLFRSFYPNGLTPEAAIEAVSLQEKNRAFIDKLSGGQRQRLAVACALVGDPEILFLDEPTTGLDPQSRRQLWEVIGGFKDRARTVVLTTHYMDEAEKLCDRVAVVDRGLVIALGTPQELIRKLGGEVVELKLTGAAPDWSKIRGVVRSAFEADSHRLTVEDVAAVVPNILDEVRRNGATLDGLTTRHPTLEDVFVDLTGRQLRDGEAA